MGEPPSFVFIDSALEGSSTSEYAYACEHAWHEAITCISFVPGDLAFPHQVISIEQDWDMLYWIQLFCTNSILYQQYSQWLVAMPSDT